MGVRRSAACLVVGRARRAGAGAAVRFNRPQHRLQLPLAAELHRGPAPGDDALARLRQTAANAAAATAATVADLKAGSQLRDSKGAPVGTIVSASAQSVVIDTGQTKIGVPLSFLAKDDKGPTLTITADQFNEAVAKAHARSEAAKAAQDQKPH